MKTLNDLFLDELADMYDAEQRIARALPRMAKAATCEDLRGAFQGHLKETEGHVRKLERVFQCFDRKAKGKTCEATVGLLKEGDEIAAQYQGSPAINAALIAVAQKLEHYEIASYGCLREWAELLGSKESAGLLQGILVEEKAANHALSELARFSKNKEALRESAEEGPPEDVAAIMPAATRRGIRAGKAGDRRVASLA